MPRFSSYPASSTLASGDTFLIHQSATSLEKQITAQNVAEQLNTLINNVDQLTIAELQALDVTNLVTGDAREVGGYYDLGDGGGGTFFYDSASVLSANGGTVIAPSVGDGRWLRAETDTYNVKWFGAVGNGTDNDYLEIAAAANTLIGNGGGGLYFPAGTYRITAQITIANNSNVNISIYGDGQNSSIIRQDSIGANGFSITFANSGILQPSRANIRDLGFQTGSVAAGTAIVVTYGSPASTSSHYNEGLTVTNVTIKSSDTGYWNTGIDLQNGWNAKITNCTISGGSQGGVWASLVGSGIRLRGSCVNTHILNNQMNFFYTGLYYEAGGAGAGYPNTEGLFCSNNSVVACRRGAWLQGNLTATSPWITGFQWTGGLIELRGGIAGLQLEGCSQARVGNAYIIDGATGAGAIGVYMGTCEDIIIDGNQFYALDFGAVTVGVCQFITVSNNVFRGGGAQVTFADGATECTSSGNSVNGAPRQEINNSTLPASPFADASKNRIYVGKNYGFLAQKSAAQSIPDATDTAVTWQTVVYDDLDFNLPGVYRFFNPATPSRIYVPPGVTRVKVTVGVRWDTSATGNRSVKIRTPVVGSYYPANSNWASDSRTATTLTDATVSTGIIELDPNNGNYFDVVATQTSGGALNIRAVEGTYVQMEIIG